MKFHYKMYNMKFINRFIMKYFS